MKKVYAIIGVVLLILGVVLSVSTLTVADTFGPEDTTLTIDQPLDYHGVPVEKGTTIVVNFESKKPGGQVYAVLLSEERFNLLTSVLEKQPMAKYMIAAALKSTLGETEETNLVAMEGEQGELEWTATEDGTYFAVFTTPTTVVHKSLDSTLEKKDGYLYNKLGLRAGSVFGSDYQCLDADDEVRAILMSEDAFSRFQRGETVPSAELLGDTVGNSGAVNWFSPTDGTYYLVLIPTGGYWPIPLKLNLDTTFVLEGSEWPLPLTYTIEGRKPGPWYLGLIPIVAGVAVLILGFRKAGAPAAPAPVPPPSPPAATYAPSEPAAPGPVRFCIHCGASNPVESKFCKKCGLKQE